MTEPRERPNPGMTEPGKFGPGACLMSLYNGKFPISILDENTDVYHGGKPATITTVLKTMFQISLM